MCQSSHLNPLVFCGIDVSAQTLAVAVEPDQHREFPNTASGHRELIAWLNRQGQARVSLEATGIYWLDLALALDAADAIEVAVLNPKTVHRFAETLSRSKTDKADARVLAAYTHRMAFTAWHAPSRAALGLRTLSRHLQALTEQRVRERNQLHAATHSALTPPCVLRDLRRGIAALDRRLKCLRRQALLLVRADATLSLRFDLLLGMPGIAEISALHLLGELAPLAPEMSVRQWVAHSGLDPAHCLSGTSVHKPSRISRAGSHHLRRALYMPALVAVRHDPHLGAFYETLLTRHKAKMQALIAVARKILHAIYGIFKTHTAYDGAKLFPHLIFTS